MRPDLKPRLFLAASFFVVGFLTCLAFLGPSRTALPTAPVAAISPARPVPQIQTTGFSWGTTSNQFYSGFTLSMPTTYRTRRVIYHTHVRDPLQEIEVMKLRSFDLIDTRSQSSIDSKVFEK